MLLEMPRAKLILHRKRLFDDGSISEIRLWQVASPVLGSQHIYKYSLFYGNSIERWVGYDNERGKGDHRHYDGQETDYTFVSPEQLIADFLSDVVDVQSKSRDEGKC